MNRRKIATRYAFLLCIAGILPVGLRAEFPIPETQAAASQTDQDAPERQLGPFLARGAVGLSAIFVDVNGSREKYRSDLNYLPGFNLSEFSLHLDSSEQGTAWLDYLNLDGRGFGDAYPYEAASLVFGKRARYEFRGDYRKQNYFFSLPSFALGGHAADSARRFTNLSLRIFPHRQVTVELGYFRNYQYGTSFSSATEFQRLFEFINPRRSLTQDFRVGAIVNHGPLLVSVFQNFRKFKDYPEMQENRMLQPDGALPEFRAGLPVRMSVPSTNFTARFVPSDRWEIGAKYLFSDGHVDASRSELLIVPVTESISLERIIRATSVSDRPEHRLELDGSVNLTDRIVFSNTFESDRFEITGSLLQTTTLEGNNPGLPPLDQDDEFASFFKYTLLRARPQLEFWIMPRLTVHAGYQYAQRTLEEDRTAGRRIRLSHLGFAGLTWRPFKNARFSLQFEKGTANDAFTQIEPRDITSWRFNSHIPIVEGLSISPHFVFSDRGNQGQDISYDADQRQGGVEVTYVIPARQITLSAGYTLFDLESLTDIRFFLENEPVQDFSNYRTRLHFFHSRVAIPLGERVMVNLGYRLLRDPRGSSYPLRRDQGEAGISYRMHTSWEWVLQWRHTSYNETLASNQDYMANLLGLTLRWSF